MKGIVAGICMLSLSLAVSQTTYANEVPLPIPQDTQIIPEKLMPSLVARGSAFADSWWPADLASRRVSADAIPEDVFRKTTRWLRTMIKPQWLPEDPNAWMVGIRKDAPSKADYLVLRYRMGNTSIQIQENGAAVRATIDTGNQSEMGAEAFLASVVRKFLRFPEDRLTSLNFYLESFEQDGKKVYYGTMDCDFDRHDPEAFTKRKWYNHTSVWTDGRRAFFSLVEMDGRPRKPTRARAGIPRRFKEKP